MGSKMIVSKSLMTTSAILAASVLAFVVCSNAYSGDAAIFKAMEDGNSEPALRLAKNGQMEVLSKPTPQIVRAHILAWLDGNGNHQKEALVQLSILHNSGELLGLPHKKTFLMF